MWLVVPLHPGWTTGWSSRSSPQAFATSCKNQYEEDWEHWELGRLQIPALLLREEIRDDGCGPPRPQRFHLGGKNRAGSGGDAGTVAGIALPGAGQVWTPSCITPCSRGHFANILATTRATLERFRDGYQNPKEQIQLSISPSASPHRGRQRPGSPARPGVPCGYPAPYRPAISKPPSRWGYGRGSAAQIGFVSARPLRHPASGRRQVRDGELRPPKGGCAVFRATFVLPAPTLFPGGLPARRCRWIWFQSSA